MCEMYVCAIYVSGAYAYVLMNRMSKSPLTILINVYVEIPAYNDLNISLSILWEYIVL